MYHSSSHNGFELSLANQQSVHAVDESRLLDAAGRVLADSPFTSAVISVAVVDDPTIHTLNRRFLEHDYPTDVLSFVLDQQDGHLEGEVVLSADTAAAAAVECGWSSADEQLLYVIHGMLHLVGHRDKTVDEVCQMRLAEVHHLRACGVDPPPDRPTQRDQLESNHISQPSGGTSIQ